jgi:hypothetical protein
MIPNDASPADLHALARELAEALEGFPVEELLSEFSDFDGTSVTLPAAARPVLDRILGTWIQTLDRDIARMPVLAGATGAAQLQARLRRPYDALKIFRRSLSPAAG